MGMFFLLMFTLFAGLFGLSVHMWVYARKLCEWVFSDGWETVVMVCVAAWVAYEIIFSDFAI